MQEKRCPDCGEVKLRSSFGETKNGAIKPYCTPCRLQRNRKWWKANRPAARRLRLKQSYGITIEDYDRMLAEQGGGCAICGGQETRRNQYGPHSLNVDHDHATGRVRGILCTNCNQGMGLLGDSIERIEKTLEYLRDGIVSVEVEREVA
jgi:hypothetical protein